MQLRSRLVGLPRERRLSACFHAEAFGYLVELPSPEPASSRFILLWCPSSSEFLRSLLPSCAFQRGPTYPGSHPSSRHHSESVHILRRLPSLRSVPSSGFRSLSTVYSALRLRGLISSRSHVQGCRRSGASLPAQRLALIEPPFPLAVVFPVAHRSALRSALAFRLRSGATPVEASASRLCSARGRVAVGSGISLPAARSPLRFFLLQVVNHRL
jgi:hypothetical protein